MADCPEVRMCVHKYADLVSNMTIYLMRNTDKGDVRVKNALSAKMDIAPNRLMKTRKAFIYNIVWTLMLPGEGNQVTYPKFTADGLLDDLVPLKPSGIVIQDTPGGYLIRYGDNLFSPDEGSPLCYQPRPGASVDGDGVQDGPA